ncbi:ABC transporter substrate-binding protein [Neorhizobium sp. DT-125]|uniref:ABC transporter substrate-binding protein n=1 Tax=Neorhizobium sp. DT-125 TaxID=3396163 RepID=UPI003F1AA669
MLGKFVIALGVAAALMSSASGVAAQQKPHRGGVLTAAMDLEPATLDPAFGNAPGKDRSVYMQIFENLYYQAADGTLTPQLAESWVLAEDGKSIVFKLRKGITFHDGTPFDAKAVKFNFDRIVNPDVKARARQFVVDMVSTDIIDDSTVRVNFRAPSGAVLAGLANEAGMIVSPTALQANPDGFARNPVGTGPFRFVSWRGGDRITVERFKDYWGKAPDGDQLPYLDGVVTRFIANSAVKIVEVRSGNVQLGDTILDKDYAQIESDPNVDVFPNHVGTAQFSSFNLTRPPFNNIELRKAVAYGINREVISRVVTGGTGVVTATFEPPSSWASDPNLKPHAYNPELARKHYAASGHKGAITLSVIQRDPDTRIAQIIQSQLAEVGIKLNIETLERQAWLDKVLSYNYDMALQRANTPRVDPDMSFSTYYSRNAGSNYPGVRDEAIFNAVDKARSMNDQKERAKVYSDIQRMLLDNYYQTYFFFRSNVDIIRTEVHDVGRDFSGQWFFTQAWLEKAD